MIINILLYYYYIMEIYVHIIYSVRMSLQYVDVNLTGSKVVGTVNSSTLQPSLPIIQSHSLLTYFSLSLFLSLSFLTFSLTVCLAVWLVR